jgi:antitoxin component YwqK of YwqJK toxin-antitoxin module
MPAKKSPGKLTPHRVYHKDGSLWAKGQFKAGKMHGYWEWYRQSGTLMRSGHFENDQQCGEWTTYNQQGKPFKVTLIKPKAKRTAA